MTPPPAGLRPERSVRGARRCAAATRARHLDGVRRAPRTGLDPLGAARATAPSSLRLPRDRRRPRARRRRRRARLGRAPARRPPTTSSTLNLEEPDDLDDAWIAETARSAREARRRVAVRRRRACGTSARAIAATACCCRRCSRRRRRARWRRTCARLRDAQRLRGAAGESARARLRRRAAPARLLRARRGCAPTAGLLLDVAHLAIYQRATRPRAARRPRRLPARSRRRGARRRRHASSSTAAARFVDDDHAPEPLPDTWEILDAVLPRATQPARRGLRVRAQSARARARRTSSASRNALEWTRAFARRRAYVARGASVAEPSRRGGGPQASSARWCGCSTTRASRRASRAATRRRSRRRSSTRPARVAARARSGRVAADRDGQPRRRSSAQRHVRASGCAPPSGPHGDGDAHGSRRSRRARSSTTRSRTTRALPLAFAAFAEARAAAIATPLFAALVALEAAMLRARRATAPIDVAAATRCDSSSSARRGSSRPGGHHRGVGRESRRAKPRARALPAVATGERESSCSSRIDGPTRASGGCPRCASSRCRSSSPRSSARAQPLDAPARRRSRARTRSRRAISRARRGRLRRRRRAACAATLSDAPPRCALVAALLFGASTPASKWLLGDVDAVDARRVCSISARRSARRPGSRANAARRAIESRQRAAARGGDRGGGVAGPVLLLKDSRARRRAPSRCC